MKLLYVLSEYLPQSGGGIISHYGRILPRLVDRGHEVSVLLASREQLDHAPYEVDGVRVQPLLSKYLDYHESCFRRWEGLDVLYYLLPIAWAAREQARETIDVDLVEVIDWALLFMPWMVTENTCPVTVSLHGSCGQVDWFWRPLSRMLDSDLTRIIEEIALRQADNIHANSYLNASFWRDRIDRQIRVIPPAHGSSSPLEFCRAQNNQQEPMGLVVGRLQNWKGPELLCQALRSIPGMNVEWVGADTEWDALGMQTSEYLAINYPDVFGTKLRYFGPVDRSAVINKLHTTTFLIVPSLWDVFNLTVAEGMEAGLPVVCSKAAGAEMLINHGVNGYLFDPDDPCELVNCLNSVFTMDADERSEMGRRARLAVKTLLNEDTILLHLEEAYTSAVGQSTLSLRDPWLNSLLSPASQPEKAEPPDWPRRVARKFASMLANF